MSLNKVMLIGNLTRDAEIRQAGQNQLAVFGLATSERFRKEDGTVSESVEFHDVTLWGNTGIYPYLKKGQALYVEGSIKTNEWTGNDGVKRTAKVIKAHVAQLLGSRPQQQPQAAQPQQPQYQQAAMPPAPPTRRATPPVPPITQPPMPPQQPQYQQAPPPQMNDYTDYGGQYADDLPF